MMLKAVITDDEPLARERINVCYRPIRIFK
jgi:hypothetical protein